MRMICYFSILILLTSCVSVSLKPKEVSKSKNYEFTIPQKKFIQTNNPDVDYFWIHQTNGNSITLRTSCNDPVDPKLETLEKLSLQGLEVHKKILLRKIKYNSREALESLSQCNLDGVDINIHLVILKKNNCNYVLSYLGISKNFNQDKEVFANFVNNFEVK